MITSGNIIKNLAIALSALIISCGSVNALTLSLSTSNIDFGTMNPGDFTELSLPAGYYNRVSVISDSGNVWYLKISSTAPLTNTILTSVTIPNSAFKWMSTHAGSQNAPYGDLSAGLYHPPTGGYINFSQVDELVYTASSDYINTPNGTEIQFKYAIGMPDSQTAGSYQTTVVYTVTQ